MTTDLALEGVTVLDLSQGIAGPYCASLLRDQGARVIKVEPPSGDWLRKAGGRVGNSTAMFETFNRGKQAIILDLKSAAGANAARRIAEISDVVVENARVGSLERLGLGHADLAARRPELVYTSISGFDPAGPYARRPATDTVIQAYTGLTLNATSLPQAPRLKIAVADIVTGLYAAQATLAALVQRWRGGSGQWVRINLAHSMASLQAYKIADTLVNGPSGEMEAFAIAGNYVMQDGSLSVSASSDAQVIAALMAVKLGGLMQRQEFADPARRQANQVELRLHLSDALKTMTVQEAEGLLQSAEVPCQRVFDYPSFVSDSELNAPGLFKRVSTVDGASMPAVRTPGTAAGTEMPRAPALDEHAQLIRSEFHLASV